jgi:hypothetical protein
MAAQPYKAEENYDALFNIRPIINLTKDTYMNVFECSTEVSTDESILHFKGQIVYACKTIC